MFRRLFLFLIAGTCCQTIALADPDPCTGFTWDVSHELAVMKQTTQPVAAATKPGKDVPALRLDQVYEITLTSQSAVTFAATPGKPTLPDNAQAGLVRFRTDKAGRYRVSSTSGHWIDIVDGQDLIKSRDFQGARGCARPHKIVEFDLPGGKELVLQLSGSPDKVVVLVLTPVASAP